MPLVNAKCTNCGATLSVDNTKDALICQFCGSAFVVEKAINNYTVSNSITANTVNIYGDSNRDFIIRGGILEKYQGESLKVEIPDNVREIQKEAFANTYIEEVKIPNSVVKIGEGAFFKCEMLKSIEIPDSVKYIGYQAFAYCKALDHIVIPGSVERIEYGTFYECEALSNVALLHGIKFIGEGAFACCRNLKKIIISANIQWILSGDSEAPPSCSYRYSAFFGCPNLTDVTFEDSNDIPKFCGHFPNSTVTINFRREQQLQLQRKGVCDYCGGKFKGLIKKTCEKCGNIKRY